jgi:cyclase
MLRSRIIPSLLIRDRGLVKTVKFSNDKYVGDPINAVKIFNEKEVDELSIFDIGMHNNYKRPDFELLKKIAQEAAMPLCYGGGVSSVDDAIKLVSMGYEKVSVSSAAINNPQIIKDISSAIGSQSTIVTVDVKKKIIYSGYNIYTENASKKRSDNYTNFIKKAEDLGAGEILINSIDKDGTMEGYDLALARITRETVSIPISILGGAGSMKDIEDLINEVGLVGACAGSIFVFNGPFKAVLISYTRP